MTTERPDLYAILVLTPHATQDEIGHAYRSLLRRHHPDTRATADQMQGARSNAALQQVLAAYSAPRPRPASQLRLCACYESGARLHVRADADATGRSIVASLLDAFPSSLAWRFDGIETYEEQVVETLVADLGKTPAVSL